MKSVTIKINDKPVNTKAGLTVWEAAKAIGIDVPALCFKSEFGHTTSCMVCVVRDIASKQLIPSCSVKVSEGLQIDTDCQEVREARKDALEFLLAEHVGDCVAPCQRICPAHGNIPQMIRFIQKNRFKDALITIKRDIALPAVMGYICPAPCEKGCKRNNYDEAVSICLLKKFVAEVDLHHENVYFPHLKSKSGKQVAIVGAGPTGLAAAYYLAIAGHECTVFDKNSQPGGMLRYGVSEEKLPRIVLESEIKIIKNLGVKFVLGTKQGKILDIEKIRQRHDAVVLATGKEKSRSFEESKIEYSDFGFKIDPQTFKASLPGVFAGGGAVKGTKLAIRSLADGKEISMHINRFLTPKNQGEQFIKFDSKMGKISTGEVQEYLKNSPKYGRVEPGHIALKKLRDEEAVKESFRCFSCDCRKPLSCKLRQYAEEYQAKQFRKQLNNN